MTFSKIRLILLGLFYPISRFCIKAHAWKSKQKSTGVPDMGRMLVEILHTDARFGPKVGQNGRIKLKVILRWKNLFPMTSNFSSVPSVHKPSSSMTLAPTSVTVDSTACSGALARLLVTTARSRLQSRLTFRNTWTPTATSQPVFAEFAEHFSPHRATLQNTCRQLMATWFLLQTNTR